ncbi:hypothetical protein [Halorussus amylolyticus]|uniref:hypothetical protein n=1 Tax=Halorussus amylolyticus TaxID=1126242 RepID=UPI00138F1400|nr:hypothetical protein [Halorussus amylolyticus]
MDEDQAEDLATPANPVYAVEVQPPSTGDVPPTVERFLRGILEVQTGFLGVRNTSPWVAYELFRPRTDRLRLQFCVPNARLERKVRTHLSNEIPEIGFTSGTPQLPVKPGDSIGGAILTTGRRDRYPLATEFDPPPSNSLVAALHRHAMRDTRVVVQVLLRPVVGRSIREWWRKRDAYKTVDHLRSETSRMRDSQSATPRKRNQADAVETKIDQRRYQVCIRFAVIGAGEYTASRVKEIAGAFNVFENPVSGQYFDIDTIRGLRQKRFLEFVRAIRDRVFGGYSLRFHATVDELAGLVSIPDRDQENLENA